jgi:hypothetical protein
MKRVLYFLYYIKELDRAKFRKFIRVARSENNKSLLSLYFDLFSSSLKYNISILDYFYFRFYKLNHNERSKWAGTGYLYEYQLIMNPKGAREILENKILFLTHYRSFLRRDFADINQINANSSCLRRLMENKSGKIVLKGSRGQVGKEVEVVRCEDYNADELLKRMSDKGYDLVEEFVTQHPSLMELSPSGLNTVRIFTQLNGSNVDILGARLRVSVNSPVDNMGAGNIAAYVNTDTGIVSGPGVYSDITKNETKIHPITGKAILNFQIPYWKEVLEMTRQAAVLYPQNRSIGWDIAITATGPELIEGNHNWCKLLWQLPVKQGLKKELEKYL